MLTLNPKSAEFLPSKFAPVLHQPLGRSGQWRFASNDDPRSLNLGSGLFAVASISHENAARLEDRKDTGGSRKPAKVSDVRQMRHQQRIQRVAIEDGLQPLQPAFVVHLGSLTSQSKQ